MKITRRLIASQLMAIGAALASWANQPDSVSLFAYSNSDGHGGLKLAWSANGKSWHPLLDSRSIVNSDFGPWGSMKTMFSPVLRQQADGSGWVCTWQVADGDSATAFASSADLKKWSPQIYTSGPSTSPANSLSLRKAFPAEILLGGKTRKGYVSKVAYSTIADLLDHTDAIRHRESLNSQLMKDDHLRFASLKPVEATLSVSDDSAKAISPNLIGIFFEDINYSADGGLYAELVQNRDFEYSPSDRHNWHPAYGWTATTATRDTTDLTIATSDPLHPNNPHYVQATDIMLSNGGYDGITLKAGDSYRLSLSARGKATITASLVDADGKVLASRSLKVSSGAWKKYACTLKAAESASGASLRLDVKGTCDLDMVSLFPADTFRGRENGLRKDLATVLADLKPKFVRFPGGCVAHGDGVDNIYDWKGSVGPLESRRPLRNLWGYHQTRGLGYHEYFQFCEDIGATPLPVLAAGVPCQNSGRPAHHSHDAVTSYGQQCGIPMEEMDEYVQDILDLVEYANGDARTSKWGRERAKAGHPAPFNLKYIGIGNEDMITEVFEERFAIIADAVKKAYPDIRIVGTVGPFYEGTDYDRGWEFATEQGIPVVDEHYYVSPGWLIHNNDYYDNYDRSKPHVYLGEYASHMPDRASNLEAALSNAIYLTGVERNGDVVELSSYAPLLAKKNRTQWRPDLIYFDNDSVTLTPDYYVQQMYGSHGGDMWIPNDLKVDSKDAEVKCRVGASVVRDSSSGATIVRLANLLPVETTVKLSIPRIAEAVTARKICLSGNPADTAIVPVESTETIVDGCSVALPPYSFTNYVID